MIELVDDPRWHRLQAQEVRCRSCDQAHSGVFDISFGSPIYWQGDDTYSENSSVLESANFLSEDLCIVEGEDYFARCVLKLPISGSGQCFGFGVWTSLSRASFDEYLEHFDDGKYPPGTQWFGWFSNTLQAYPETLSLKCNVSPQSGRQRPLIEIQPSDHPLSIEQQNGITLDRLLEIYAAHGHQLDLDERAPL